MIIVIIIISNEIQIILQERKCDHCGIYHFKWNSNYLKKRKYDYRDNYYFEWNSNYSSGKENMNCTVYGKKENV